MNFCEFSSWNLVLLPIKRRSTWFQLDSVHGFALCRHPRRFKGIWKPGNEIVPVGGLCMHHRALPCPNTHISLHSNHMARRLDQHKPRFTATSHIPLNLFDATQLNTCHSLGRQCMEHMSAQTPTTSHSNCTHWPIDNGIGCLLSISTKNNVMIQTWQKSTLYNTVQHMLTC